MTTLDEYSALVGSLDALDALADIWAEETNVAAISTSISKDDSERAGAIEAIMRLSFVEGAYRMYCAAVDGGLIAAPPKLPANISPPASSDAANDPIAPQKRG